MAQTNDPVAQFNQLIGGIEVAMLTTIRADGTLHSCPMAAQPADASGAIWFFSGNHTEKVDAIKADQHVNLAYADPPVSATFPSPAIANWCAIMTGRRSFGTPLTRLGIPTGSTIPTSFCCG